MGLSDSTLRDVMFFGIALLQSTYLNKSSSDQPVICLLCFSMTCFSNGFPCSSESYKYDHETAKGESHFLTQSSIPWRNYKGKKVLSDKYTIEESENVFGKVTLLIVPKWIFCLYITYIHFEH